jgi:hypothetical protein
LKEKSRKGGSDMIDANMKIQLLKLQDLLNSIVTYEDLQNEKVLKISKELDILINEIYTGSEAEVEENKA